MSAKTDRRLEWIRDYRARSLLTAIERMNHWTASNIIIGAAHHGVRRFFGGAPKTSRPELRRDIGKAIDAAIEELNELRRRVGVAGGEGE